MTVIILAGGKSSRMGQDKLLLPYEGEGLLLRAIRRYSRSFSRVYVSVADASRYPAFSGLLLPDLHPGCGPLSGLEAGLCAAAEPVFLTAGDMPFSSPEAALKLYAFLSAEADACTLQDDEGRPEPLFGWYRPSVLPQIRTQLSEQRYSMQRLLEHVSSVSVSPARLGPEFDGKLLMNVNDPEEYADLLRL